MNAPLARDSANEALLARVGTSALARPPSHDVYDLVAIGGGTAGLVGTAGMAMLGARVALVERHLMGGDCLVTGCVPSKALLHAAQLAHSVRRAEAMGIATGETRVDFGRVMTALRETRAAIAHDDSVETVRERGIEVLHGQARFTGANTLEVDGNPLRFKRCLAATGGRPRIPEVPGLAEAEPSTSETLFELQGHPGRLAVIGGGPMGCELAQAMQRLGVPTTLVQRGSRLLPGDDPEASSLIAEALRSDGVDVRLGADLVEVSTEAGVHELRLRTPGSEDTLTCDRILVTAGRRPNVEGLELDAAGIDVAPKGIVVDARHRTSNRRVYAAGDVAAQHQFTHAAWAQAEYAVLNAFFPLWLNVRNRPMPWATYTDPEVAHVGLTCRELETREVDTLRVPLLDNDRARIEGETAGFAKVHLRRGSDRIVSATIVARSAGELITPLTMAMTRGIGLSKLASTIVPYPTRSEMVRDLAYAYSTQKVSPLIVRLAQRWFTWLR